MNKSEIFILAHHKTRIAKLKALVLKKPFSYKETFAFYLKSLRQEHIYMGGAQ